MSLTSAIRVEQADAAIKSAKTGRINTLARLRFCVDQQSCEHCRSNSVCKRCLVVRSCLDDPSGCREDPHAENHPDIKVDLECAICLESYQNGQELRVLPCRHYFHSTCADKWLCEQLMSSGECSCPMCKAIVFHLHKSASAAAEAGEAASGGTGDGVGGRGSG